MQVCLQGKLKADREYPQTPSGEPLSIQPALIADESGGTVPLIQGITSLE